MEQQDMDRKMIMEVQSILAKMDEHGQLNRQPASPKIYERSGIAQELIDLKIIESDTTANFILACIIAICIGLSTLAYWWAFQSAPVALPQPVAPGQVRT